MQPVALGEQSRQRVTMRKRESPMRLALSVWRFEPGTSKA